MCCIIAGCLQAINNPKGRIPGSSSDRSSSASGSSSLSGGSKGSEGLRRGTKPGEGAVREVAAYVLDHGHFSGVPPTALVSAYVSGESSTGTSGAVKVGSLQQFVESEGDCEERGESVLQQQLFSVLDRRSTCGIAWWCCKLLVCWHVRFSLTALSGNQ